MKVETFLIKDSSLDLIALGAEANASFTIIKNNQIYFYTGFGNIYDDTNYANYTKAITKEIKKLNLTPKIIVADKHPEYNSTKFAKELQIWFKKNNHFTPRILFVQHHHAHIAYAANQFKLKNYVGIVMDGLGYGEDKTIWGGEVFLVANQNSFKRMGHLEPQTQLGDSATNYPKKMLISILSKCLSEQKIIDLKLYSENETKLYLNQLKQRFNTIESTSTGRVLDSVAALLDVCDKKTNRSDPAIELEKFAGNAKPLLFAPLIVEKNNAKILLTTPLIEFILNELEKQKKQTASEIVSKEFRQQLAMTAQVYLAEGVLKIANSYANKKANLFTFKKIPIVFSGGVAYNKTISGILRKNGVFVADNPGDATISLGQAIIGEKIN